MHGANVKIKHTVSQIILHYIVVMSLFNVKKRKASDDVELLTSTWDYSNLFSQ
jgi:hypothetical protein